MMRDDDLSLKRDPRLVALAVALWVLTSVVGFLEILTIRAIVLRIYGHFAVTYGFYSREVRGAQALGMMTLVVAGILCLGVAVGCGEYHLRNFGRPQSWKLFGRTIAVEVAIFVLASFI